VGLWFSVDEAAAEDQGPAASSSVAALAKSGAEQRAERRAYDGAPPVIPHRAESARCVECHGAQRIEVPGLGFSPPSPHAKELAEGALARCRQCHVERRSEKLFAETEFAGLRQDLRHGPRQTELSPPRIPHRVFMRENCAACHTGPAARAAIETPHPERVRCRQCHLEVQTTQVFRR